MTPEFSRMVYDCTLREGMQSLYGPRFSHELRMDIALRLAEIGVRRIELGSPAAGEGMQKSIREIAAALPDEVESWAHIRCHPNDLKTVPDNVDAVGIYFGTSDLQMEFSHGKQEEEIIRRASDVASAAIQQGRRVRFTAEDATRTPVDRLLRVYQGVIERTRELCGAYPTVVGVADTTGAATPSRIHTIITRVREVIPDDVVVEFHGHNDRGFAAVNALTAIQAGAGSVQVALLGLGERNGITSMGEFVSNLELEMPDSTNSVNKDVLVDTAQWLSEELGVQGHYREPLGGAGYFADLAGVHANGSVRNAEVYHIISPEQYGQRLAFPINHPVVGRHAVLNAAQALGLPADGPNDERILQATATLKERTFRWRREDSIVTEEDANELLREIFMEKVAPVARTN